MQLWKTAFVAWRQTEDKWEERIERMNMLTQET